VCYDSKVEVCIEVELMLTLMVRHPLS
jgi:hypothetical protein